MRQESTKKRRSNAAGFTLVELMVVISIIAILATIVGFNVLGSVDEGNKAAAQAQIKNFKTALIGYKLKFKSFPNSLDELINNSKGLKFLDGNAVPKDPWGNDYIYTNNGSSFEIISYGADGRQGGSGEYDADISSETMGGNN